MSETSEAAAGGLVLSFLLGEIRELRNGLENRDGRLHESISGLREDVHSLSTAVTKSQDRVNQVEERVAAINTIVIGLKDDVHSIKQESAAAKVAWDGPKRAAKGLILVGATVAAITGIVVFIAPAITALLQNKQ